SGVVVNRNCKCSIKPSLAENGVTLFSLNRSRPSVVPNHRFPSASFNAQYTIPCDKPSLDSKRSIERFFTELSTDARLIPSTSNPTHAILSLSNSKHNGEGAPISLAAIELGLICCAAPRPVLAIHTLPSGARENAPTIPTGRPV